MDDTKSILAEALDEAPEEGLQKHDQKYHGGHYDGGTCKYREERGIATAPNPADQANAEGKIADVDTVQNPPLNVRANAPLGVPYQGSKSRIARSIIEALPGGKRFVDLFCGGCAMSHAAMLSGKYDRYAMNDLNPMGQRLFLEGLNGRWRDYDRKEMTEEEFAAIKGTPESLPWSFNGLGRNLAKKSEGGRDRAAEQIRRVKALESLKGNADKIDATETDYRKVNLQDGDVVYADIPYSDTDQRGYRHAEKFDKEAFDKWAQAQNVPVYVSEYNMGDGWTEIASFPVPAMRGGHRTEKLYVQSKFANAGGKGEASAVTPEEDAAYMDAVERGDMDTAARMVREAAKERGYEVFGLHGTRGEFTVFDKKRIGTANDEGWLGRGFYFWDKGNRTYAEQYANGGKVMEVMLSMQEPYLIDKAEMERLIDAADRHDVEMLEDFSNEVKANGYDSVIDGDGQMLVFEPNQIKSADPVTYDDAGNVIPLSQRFNRANPDIRYAKSSGDGSEPTWTRKAKALAQSAAKMMKRFIPGLRVRLSETPYEESGADERKSISGVFTGSQADYDQPSLQYVGTGVGAQNQGYGLYGVGSPDSARFFLNIDRDMSRLLKVNGETLDPDKERIFDETSHGKYIALQNVLKTGDREEALSKLRNGEVGSLDRPEVQKAIEFLENTPDIRVAWKEGVQRNDYNNPEWQVGNLYEQTFFTDRKGKWQDYLLDYDNNVSRRQWEKIKSALVSQHPDFGQELVDEIDEETSGRPTGAEIYEAISYYLDSEGTAKFLTSIGIDGVRYQASQQGTPGYVSFRDDNIRVDHKWTNGEMRYFKGEGGKVVGTYDRRTGEVVLYPGADKNTIAHELGGHATWQYAEQQAARGDDTLLRKMNEVVDSAPKNITQEVAQNYGKETAAVQREEVWAHVMGNRGSAAIQKALETKRGKTWWKRFWNTAKDAWRGLASRIGLNRVDTKAIAEMTPDEFADYMAKEMTSGKVLGEIQYGSEGSDEGTRKSFIGEKGAARLGIKGRGDAEEMEKSGASREDIWHKTGWWRGKDGKWRVEIPDVTQSEVDLIADLVLEDFKWRREHGQPKPFPYASLSYGLAELAYGLGLPHISRLIDAYPGLHNVEFRGLDTRTTKQGYGGATMFYKELDSNGELVPAHVVMPLAFRKRERIKGAIVHELQHLIQAYEGFPNGGTRAKGAAKDTKKKPITMEEYETLPGEVEAYATAKRAAMSAEERAKEPPWVTEEKVMKEDAENRARHEAETAAATTAAAAEDSAPEVVFDVAAKDALVAAFDEIPPEALAAFGKTMVNRALFNEGIRTAALALYGESETYAMDATPDIKDAGKAGKGASGQRPQCDATFADCKAKNPMMCRYHGPKLMEWEFRRWIRNALGGARAAANVQVAVTRMPDAPSPCAFRVTVACTPSQKNTVMEYLRLFLQEPGIKPLNESASAELDANGAKKYHGLHEDERGETIGEFEIDELRVDRPPARQTTFEQSMGLINKKRPQGTVGESVPWHRKNGGREKSSVPPMKPRFKPPTEPPPSDEQPPSSAHTPRQDIVDGLREVLYKVNAPQGYRDWDAYAQTATDGMDDGVGKYTQELGEKDSEYMGRVESARQGFMGQVQQMKELARRGNSLFADYKSGKIHDDQIAESAIGEYREAVTRLDALEKQLDALGDEGRQKAVKAKTLKRLMDNGFWLGSVMRKWGNEMPEGTQLRKRYDDYVQRQSQKDAKRPAEGSGKPEEKNAAAEADPIVVGNVDTIPVLDLEGDVEKVVAQMKTPDGSSRRNIRTAMKKALTGDSDSISRLPPIVSTALGEDSDFMKVIRFIEGIKGNGREVIAGIMRRQVDNQNVRAQLARYYKPAGSQLEAENTDAYAKTLVGLVAAYPNMRHLLKDTDLTVQKPNNPSWGGSTSGAGRIVAVAYPDSQKVHKVPLTSLYGAFSSLSFANNLQEQRQLILAHEIGHVVYRHLNPPMVFDYWDITGLGNVDKDYLSEIGMGKEDWKDAKKAANRNGRIRGNASQWKSEVTNYAKTTDNEMHSECLAIYTHPLYYEGRLPKPIEEYCAKLLGEDSASAQRRRQKPTESEELRKAERALTRDMTAMEPPLGAILDDGKTESVLNKRLEAIKAAAARKRKPEDRSYYQERIAKAEGLMKKAMPKYSATRQILLQALNAHKVEVMKAAHEAARQALLDYVELSREISIMSAFLKIPY